MRDAGSTGRWWFGDKDIELDEHGWHAGNSGGSTLSWPEKANPWGFHDMNGLVNEWCADAWERTYSEDGSSKLTGLKVRIGSLVRGGSWFTESDSTRSSARSFADRDKRSDGLGVRLVWAPLDEQPEDVGQGASSSSAVQS